MSEVRRFYENEGWVEDEEGLTKDTRIFEDLRPCAQDYVSKTRLRVARFIPPTGDRFLDVGCGALPHREYLGFSKGYSKRYCVDFSEQALGIARRKLGDHGEYICGDFLELDLEDSSFDCSICLHVLFHVDRSAQEAFVRKLIRVTRPGRPVILIYANPRTFIRQAVIPVRALKAVVKRVVRYRSKRLYYHVYPLPWWRRFDDVAEVSFHPHRSFGTSVQKRLFPSNGMGERMFDALYRMEERFPGFFVRHFEFPIIVLRRHGG